MQQPVCAPGFDAQGRPRILEAAGCADELTKHCPDALTPDACRAEATRLCATAELLDLSPVAVPLDNTGIADWDLLNRRDPFPLVRKAQIRFRGPEPASAQCFAAALEHVYLAFENRTVDRTFIVKMPFEYPLPGERLTRLLDDLSLEVRLALAEARPRLRTEMATALAGPILDPGDLRDARRVEENLEDPASLDEQLAELEKDPASDPGLLQDLENLREALGASSRALARDLAAELTRKVEDAPGYSELEKQLDALQAPAVPPAPPGKEQLDRAIDRARAIQQVRAGLSLLQRQAGDAELSPIEELRLAVGRPAVPPAQPLEPVPEAVAPATPLQGLVAWLDGFRAVFEVCLRALPGLEAALSENRVRSLDECRTSVRQHLDKVPAEAGLDPSLQRLRAVILAAATRLVDVAREVREDFDLIVGRTPGQSLDEACKRTDGTLACTLTVTVSPSSTARLNGKTLRLLPKGTVEITVSFFEEVVSPANPSGFLATVAAPPERESRTGWSLKGSVGAARDPDLVPDPEDEEVKAFSPDYPYRGARRSRTVGTAAAEIKRTLGDRADGSVTFAFKSGDLGEKETTRDVIVPTYNLNVYAKTGLFFRFGKYAVASPASKIAVNESGEGFELRYRWLSLGQVVKRESAEGTADRDDEDSRVTILQANNLSLGPGSFLRSANFLVLRGEDEKVGLDYRTYGAELHFAAPTSRFSGSLAYYHSERETEEEGKAPEAEGDVTLVTATYAQIDAKDPSKARRSFTVQAGMGSGDDPDTPDRDEGYAGETAAFAPDLLFLKTLAGKIDTGGMGTVGSGLSNKLYAGLAYTEFGFSPLRAIAQLLHTRDKIASERTRVILNLYRFDEPVLGSRQAGTELDLEFLIEVPRGVTGSLTIGRFFPGRSLEPIFDEEPWSVVANLTVNMDR